jgi:hypothetical protein
MPTRIKTDTLMLSIPQILLLTPRFSCSAPVTLYLTTNIETKTNPNSSSPLHASNRTSKPSTQTYSHAPPQQVENSLNRFRSIALYSITTNPKEHHILHLEEIGKPYRAKVHQHTHNHVGQQTRQETQRRKQRPQKQQGPSRPRVSGPTRRQAPHQCFGAAREGQDGPVRHGRAARGNGAVSRKPPGCEEVRRG